MGEFLDRVISRKKNKKIGLGLGGGGAKGAVHLGALRLFEEEGIEFDVVAGTSIGSIVGGLYSRGYTYREIDALVMNGKMNDMKSLIVSRLTGSGVDDILAASLGRMEFSDLKIPFAAVAVDLDSGKEEVFKEGDLIAAMAASSAIAPFFRPVTIDGKRYVDGAYRNIIPCDVVREMGADVVIGVDLSCRRLSTQAGKHTLDELHPNNGVPICNPTAAGYDACDVMITPDLEGYTSTSFSGIAEMFDIGYFAAKDKLPEIKKAIAKRK